MKIKANDAYQQFMEALQSELQAAHDIFADSGMQSGVVDGQELEHALNALRTSIQSEVQELLDITHSND